MRILWVKAGKLLPIDTGGKIRSYHLLRELARRHDVTLLSYYGGSADPGYDRALREHLPGAEPMSTALPRDTPSDYLAHLFSSAPYAVTKFTSRRVAGIVREWLSDGRFDVAVCDFLSASLNFPRASRTPVVLFQHNVESVLWQRQAAHEPNLVRRLAFSIEAGKMARYEPAAVRRFAHVIAVSDRDRDVMAAMTDPSRISVVPTGVDVGRFRDAAATPPAGPLVMFLGSMDWEANVDAVSYFCADIWPRVRAAVPGAHLRVVGRNPDARVQVLRSESVEITGTVPSVVEHLQQAAVVVVPLRVGGGTRLKIFEAMAAGRAVVSTSIGAEGLDVTDGHDVLLADDARQFETAVIDLLQHPDRRRRIASAAAETAARHDWPAVAAAFDAVLDRACGGPLPMTAAAPLWQPQASTR
jgi:glycosyltransferase involved in cell wall biosynthesis